MDLPTLDQLSVDPHPHLAALRSQGQVHWVPALQGWLVLGHRTAIQVMRDAATFTVDDPRFTTGQVVGPSMLSTDGAEHARHRKPFLAPFTLRSTRERFTTFADEEAARLVGVITPLGAAELRTSVAGPMAVAGMQLALGLESIPVAELLAWYRGIVKAVADLTAGAAVSPAGRESYQQLSIAVQAAIAQRSGFLAEVLASAGELTETELVSNIAVLLFGGIETTEGMIATLMHHLLTYPEALAQVLADATLLDAAIEESLRLEPAAAEVDRYATQDISIGRARIRRGDLVIVSLTGANRDPQVFPEPDHFRLDRRNGRHHLAFAQGPHVCLGMHLTRLETRAAATALLRLPGLRLTAQTTPPTGLVFRKPDRVAAEWDVVRAANPSQKSALNNPY